MSSKGRGRGNQDMSGSQHNRGRFNSKGRSYGVPRGRQERGGSYTGQEREPYGIQDRESYGRQEQSRRGGFRGRGDRGGNRGGKGAPARSFEGYPFSEPYTEDPDDDVKFSAEDFGMTYKLGISTPALPLRPGLGKLGEKIKLISNCFSLKAPTGYVYHYDVDVFSRGHSTATGSDTESKFCVLNKKRNREIVCEMLRCNDFFDGTFAAYDGKKNLFCRRALEIDEMDNPFSCTVVLEKGGTSGKAGALKNQEFRVVVKPVRKKNSVGCSINLDTLHALYAGIIKAPPLDAIMAIETILRHGPCLRFTSVGQSFFSPPAPNDLFSLCGGKEIWFGYHQSVRLGQWKPLINLDVSATVFYEKGPILNYLRHILGTDENTLHQVGILEEEEINVLSRKLKDMQIETTHLKSYRRKYRIFKITKEAANKLTFPLTINGETVQKTVARYFQEKYNFTLKFPHLPCIQARPDTKNIYLPLEVCEVVQGQHYKEKLEENDTSEIIKFTAHPPLERFTEIKDIRRERADYDQDEVLKGFDISVRNEPLQLDGRILDVPSILYNDKSGEKEIKPFNGSWDMRETKYFRGANIYSWVLLNFSNPKFCNDSHLKRFTKMLCEIASLEGISISRPASVETVNFHSKPVEMVIRNAQKQYNADLAIVVIPTRPGSKKGSKEIYNEVKKASETILGIVTQCITASNLVTNCKPQVVSNLCQKINAKMGGVNNSLVFGELPPVMRTPVMRTPVMLIGADVNHASPTDGYTEGVSIAAVVGSLDAHPSRYAVAVRAQRNRNEAKESIETIVDMEEMMKEMLRAFYIHTRKKRPERIIVYRDGVSDGQFQAVQDHELKCIRKACRAMQASDYEPAITFVIMQKRHHTRFMPYDARQGVGRMRNIPPGTIVDNTVTHPLNFDFFLCSHVGIQGTSRPCHYTVTHDDNNFTADDIQKLTFYLCHTYARCTRSISCPSPVRYAHLAAYRARQHAISDQQSSSDARSSSSSRSPLFSENLLEKVGKAIKVMDGLANTMYFV